jgi:hypothetical protein
VAKRFSKNKCGPGQPPEPHRSWISTLAFPPLGAARSTVLVRQRSRRVPHLPVLAAEHDSENMIRRIASLQPLRWPAAQPAQGASCRGGRNARATGMRSRAFPISPSNSPSRIASCHRRHRNHHPASFENSTFSLNSLSAKILRPATGKTFPLVQKLWTIRLPCGSLRKTGRQLFVTLDAAQSALADMPRLLFHLDYSSGEVELARST